MHGLAAIEREFEGSVFADERLKKRAIRISEQLGKHPALSFPDIFSDPSQLEGAYRFMSNERVTLDDVMSGHVAGTVKRAAAKKCLAIHDTTDFVFDGEREDLGLVDRSKQGFYAHVCICVSADGLREPLGVLDTDAWTRAEKKKGKRPTKVRKTEAENESRRWLEQSLKVEELVKTSTQLIHVEDREGDIYESFEMRLAHDMHFIVRATSSKVVLTANGTENVLEYSRKFPVVTTRDIYLSARDAKYPGKAMKQQHPPRAQRECTVALRAGNVRLRKPAASGTLPELTLNAVHVLETNAPKGEAPVEWLLLTTEPISSKAEVEEIVDNYRARWLIEEYFKALKTGCKYEERQLESRHALLNALGLFSLMAWRLLQLRFIERTATEAPATTIATPAEISVLEAEVRMPPRASASEFMLRLARFGGHLPQNGRPGLLILWRGLRKLLELAKGFEIAQKM